METRTKDADRLLEAITPILDEELERILEGRRQELELEFNHNLETALAEAASSAQIAAQVQLEQAVNETREQVRNEVTTELEARFAQTMDETTSRLRSEFTTELEQATDTWDAECAKLSAECARLSGQSAQLTESLEEQRLLASVQGQLADSGSQNEMLVRFLRLAEHFAPSCSIYVARAESYALWKSRGEAAFPEILASGSPDSQWFFREIIVRDRPLAAVCALPPFRIEGLNYVTICLERAIALFGMRARTAVRDS